MITQTFPPAKAYWLREEIPIADKLLSLAPALTREFLAYHTDFIDGDFKRGTPYSNADWGTPDDAVKSSADAWKTDGLKYTYKDKNVFVDKYKWLPQLRERYPTAVALTEEYGDDCPISAYSILESNSVIKRHTGMENRDNEFIRIHIPLIVPPGDIYFECEGVEIDWSDIWAFDNQLVHSAHNPTPHRRLVYLIDIRRSRLGLEVGEKYSEARQNAQPPFVRGAKPKVLHTCQRPSGSISA
jgi:hypothetical protein